MSEKLYDVIGLGDPFQDLVIELDKIPPSNTNMRMKEYWFQGGGNVPTAIAMAGRLGLKAAIYGVAGDDILAQNNKADFAYNNVDTSHLIVDPGKRSHFCLCIAERSVNGKNFITKLGDFEIIKKEDLDVEFLQSTKVLHIGILNEAVEEATKIVHEAGGVVCIDANYYMPGFYNYYHCVDIFIASEYYYKGICDDIGFAMDDYEGVIRYVQSKGPKTVIFTFGEDGCKGMDGDEFIDLPAFKVDAVDSTGAGDVFHGAYIYGYLQGWDAKTICRFASGASAIKCTRLGSRASMPSLETLTKFLETGEIDYTEIDQRVEKYRRGFK